VGQCIHHTTNIKYWHVKAIPLLLLVAFKVHMEGYSNSEALLDSRLFSVSLYATAGCFCFEFFEAKISIARATRPRIPTINQTVKSVLDSAPPGLVLATQLGRLLMHAPQR
jgi:hypothetical protein